MERLGMGDSFAARGVPEMPELPDGPVMIEVSPRCFEVRRLTARDIETIRESEFGRWCEQMAEREVEHTGASKEEWDAEPETYIGHCYKQCYCNRTLRKGSVYEFGAYGVYVCEGCGYAYPPGCNPEQED